MDLKTFLKKVVGTVEREVENVRTSVTPQHQPTSSQPYQRPQRSQRPQQREAEPYVERTPSEWLSYFKEILAQNFGQYSVRENVPVQELAGDVSADFKLYPTRPQQAYKAEWGLPYSFVLYEGGIVKGVLLIGKTQSQYNNVKFMISRMYAKKMGLPFITFYMDAPNEREYVVDRIRGFLR